jgi:3-oxoacyl-[acyl-carrier protein] reductase/pteridine reductase
MASLKLNGKSALVTGGARRIGREIALRLAKAGADLTITFESSQEQAAQTVRAIQELGRRAQAVHCDVRSETSVREAVASTAEFHARIDILVNNAAIFESVPIDQITVEQWDAVFSTNARGPFLVARESHPYLRAAAGRIVNIGSIGGLHALGRHAHYGASKAALHMLTQSMAKAYAPEICVNCVAPGWIEMEGSDQAEAAHFAAKTPLQRNGTATDVAEAVLYFATNSGFVTGQTLAVDGGLGL